MRLTSAGLVPTVTAIWLLTATVVPAQWLEQRKLTASEPTEVDHFGNSLGVDGNIGIVGTATNFESGSAAYLFNISTGGELFQLNASDETDDDYFGSSVAISGNIAIVGAYGDADQGFNTGAAYVFDATTGDELFKLTASDAAGGDSFGSVAISGNTAIIGAVGDDAFTGSAYLFDVTTGNQLFKLTASDAVPGHFFGSVAISGNFAIVGAYGNDDEGEETGAAYVFDVTTGAELFKLTASDAALGDGFGRSVALSGNTAIIGAIGGNSSMGSAYLFDVTTGVELLELIASDAAVGDAFGYSVAISGNTVIVGSRDDDDAGSRSGSAYLFDVTTGEELSKLTASDAAPGDLFGWSVAINRNTAIVGAIEEDQAGFRDGAAYVFQEPIEWVAPVGGGWTSHESWSSGTMIPNSDSVHVLFGDAIIQPSTISVDFDVTVSNITFDNDTYSYSVEGYSGHFLTLAGDAVVDVVSGTHTLRDLAGTDGLVKTGPGTLIVSSGNTYSGTTSVNQGTLQMVDENALGNSDFIVVSAGASILSGDAYIGRAPGSDVTATVDGVGANWTATGSFYVGDQGIGALNIQNSGVVSNAFGAVGFDSGSEGSVTVSGVGALWNCSDDLHIGSSGTGLVTLAVGAQLQVDGEILVNRFAAGDGLLFVTGAGTTAQTNGELRVADEGIGFLRIEDGAVVTSASGSLARDSAGAIGSAWVDGPGTAWNIAGDLSVGVRGEGEVRLRNGGTVSVGGGAGIVNLGVEAGSQGRVLIGAGSSDTAGTLFASEVNGGLGLANINFHHVESNYTFAPVLSGTLSLYHFNTGTTILTGSNTYTGTTNLNSGTLIVNGTHTGGGEYTVHPDGTLGGSGTIHAPVTVFGKLAPGNSVGIIHIDGDYIQTVDGALEIEVGGTTPGSQHDQVEVIGVATINGRLEIPLIDVPGQPSYTPQVDDEVVLLTATGGVSGSFHSTFFSNLPTNVAHELQYNTNDVRLRFVAPEPIQFVSADPVAVWSNNATWEAGGLAAVPESETVVSVQNLAGVPQVVEVIASNESAHQLLVGDVATEIAVRVDGGSLSIAAGTTIHGHGAIELKNLGTLLSDTVDVQDGGLLAGDGTIRTNELLVSSGTLRPGFSVGHLDVDGNYKQEANGTMLMDIEGTQSGEFDTIGVTDSVELGGTLTIDASNYTSTGTETQEFEILTAGGLSGEFDTVEWSGDDDIYFFPDYDYGDGIVRIVQGTRGDMNGDGAIDTLDVDLFVFILMSGSEFKFLLKAVELCDANQLVCEFPSSQAGGDWSGSGIVDFDDIPFFQQVAIGHGLGTGAMEAAVARYLSSPPAVPEPPSALLLCWFVAHFAGARCRRD